MASSKRNSRLCVVCCVTQHDRSFGFALTDENMEDGFREFLHDGARVRLELIPSILEQLDALDAWFQTQTTFKFYSASLLMVSRLHWRRNI